MSHHTVYPKGLELRHVSYSVGSHELVTDISLGAAPAEVVGLVGPNGAGKSTVLRAAYRALTPHTGEVLLDGADISGMSRRRLARRLAAVPQEFPAEFELTASDVVSMGRTPHQRTFGGDRRGDERIVMTSLELLGVAGLSRRPFDRLSGGEKQRVLIARALAQEPELLVLDEPTNHLDMRHQFEVLALLDKLGMTALTALHDLNLAARFCDRLYLLDAGRVVAEGSPQQVLTSSLLSDVYRMPVDVGTHPRTGELAIHFG